MLPKVKECPPTLAEPGIIQKTLDPRAKRTRQLIEAAFKNLLHEKSFEAITVQDIAERATVNRATFYAHFVDKYALLDHCIREAFQEFLASKLSDNAPINSANLRLLILTVLEFMAKFHGDCIQSDQQFEPLIEIQVQVNLYQFILNWFNKQLRPKEVKAVAQIETSATALSWAVFGVALEWSRGDKKRSAEEVAGQVQALFTQGLPYSL